MDYYGVFWYRNQKAIPVDDLDFDVNNSPIILKPHPDEELFLSDASERLCRLAKKHHAEQFIIKHLSGHLHKHFWVVKKTNEQKRIIVKLTSEGEVLPINKTETDLFTLFEASLVLGMVTKAQDSEIFELMSDSPLAANVYWNY